jgi:hypothetical protein
LTENSVLATLENAFSPDRRPVRRQSGVRRLRLGLLLKGFIRSFGIPLSQALRGAISGLSSPRRHK